MQSLFSVSSVAALVVVLLGAWAVFHRLTPLAAPSNGSQASADVALAHLQFKMGKTFLPSRVSKSTSAGLMGSAQTLEEEVEEASFEQSLLAAAQRVAGPDKALILVSVAAGEHELLLNWHRTVANVGQGARVLFMADDHDSFTFLSSHWASQTARGPAPSWEAHSQSDLMAGVAPRVAHSRWGRALLGVFTLLQLRFSVLFSSVQGVWLKDPIPFLTAREAQPFDILLLDDGATFTVHAPQDAGVLPPRVEMVTRTHVLSPSFLLLRHSPASTAFVLRWMRESLKEAHLGNCSTAAAALNGVVLAYLQPLGPLNVSIGTLPPEHFPSACALFGPGTGPAAGMNLTACRQTHELMNSAKELGLADPWVVYPADGPRNEVVARLQGLGQWSPGDAAASGALPPAPSNSVSQYPPSDSVLPTARVAPVPAPASPFLMALARSAPEAWFSDASNGAAPSALGTGVPVTGTPIADGRLIPGSNITTPQALAALKEHLHCFANNGTWVLDPRPRPLPWVDPTYNRHQQYVSGCEWRHKREGGISGAAADNVTDPEKWNVRPSLKYRWQVGEGCRKQWGEFKREELCESLTRLGGNLLMVGDSLQGHWHLSMQNHLLRDSRLSGEEGPEVRSPGPCPEWEAEEGKVAWQEMCRASFNCLGPGKGPVLYFVRNDLLTLNSKFQTTARTFLPWAGLIREWNISTVVFNRGAHFTDLVDYEHGLNETLAAVRKHHPHLLILFRATAEGQLNCSKYDRPVSNPADLGDRTNPRHHWDKFPEENRIAKRLVEKYGGVYMDVEYFTLLRPDGHASDRDCLHYCLPGPVDTWTQMMYNVLRLISGLIG